MSFKQACVAALGAGDLVWVLPAPVLAQGPQPMTVAFTNVNVIPLDHEGVKQDRTVLVRGDRIVSVGSRYEVKVPSDAVVIDGAGQYLVPGLTDAHVHVSGTPVMPTHRGGWLRSNKDVQVRQGLHARSAVILRLLSPPA